MRLLMLLEHKALPTVLPRLVLPNIVSERRLLDYGTYSLNAPPNILLEDTSWLLHFLDWRLFVLLHFIQLYLKVLVLGPCVDPIKVQVLPVITSVLIWLILVPKQFTCFGMSNWRTEILWTLLKLYMGRLLALNPGILLLHLVGWLV